MRIRVFTVFHKAIDERLIYQPFSQNEIDRLFSLYAVSERYPDKLVTRMDGRTLVATAEPDRIIAEPQLHWYDPNIQLRGFMETSCYVHLLKNDLVAAFDYVGVAQYDMSWTAAAADMLRALERGAPESGPQFAFGLTCGTLMDKFGRFHHWAFPHLRNWNFLLMSYNRFFGQNWDLTILIDKPFTLFQTYLLPRAEFVALANWVAALCEEVYPWANQPPYETHWGALSGYVERAESLFIAARLHERRIMLNHLPLRHDDTIPVRLGIRKLHY